MQTAKLLGLLGNPEDNFTERKSEGVANEELRQTACAFANSLPEGREAVLFIGVHDKSGEVVGLKGDTDILQKRVRAAIDNCYPPITYLAEVLPTKDGAVLAVVVRSSSVGPRFTGPAYVRVGSESKKASEQVFNELVYSRNDKCRELMRYRLGLVTVYGIDYRLGSGQPLHGTHKEMRMCRIDEVTPHYVGFTDVAADWRFTEHLNHIEIGVDRENRRPSLSVTFPRR